MLLILLFRLATNLRRSAICRIVLNSNRNPTGTLPSLVEFVRSDRKINSEMAAYQLYRNTTLGHTLQESLDELIQYNQITPSLAAKILVQFDRSMNAALASRVKSRLTFKAGKLHTYRFCDNVWTFLLNDVEFREVHEVAKVDKVKIVACDGKGVSSVSSTGVGGAAAGAEGGGAGHSNKDH